MPDVRLDDTIAAIATAQGLGAIGIVRVSGREAISIADRIFRAAGKKSLSKAESHTILFGHVVDPDGNVLDEVLVSLFRSPKSYTAEDMVEINAHGGGRVLQNILNLVLSLGARRAEPGEFTRRAFLNGRIDLAQAEAVLDLICSKTNRSVEAALRQLDGKLSGEIKQIKDALMLLYAHLEAYLDFPNEHLEVYSNAEFQNRFEAAARKLGELISSYTRGQILREGVLTVIVGRPNVGKSSLLNALLERDRAIVSEIPGTTRDVLEEAISIDGFWVRLVDTAGLGQGRDLLDEAAMERTRRYLRDGDVLLWVLDAGEGFVEEDRKIFEQFGGKKVIPIVNKCDLAQKKDFNGIKKCLESASLLFLSAKTGEGIEDLQKKIGSLILESDFHSESAVVTHERHKQALETALEALRRSQAAFLRGESLEFVILDLKTALDALRELVGEIYSEDLLDVVFAEFCIGK